MSASTRRNVELDIKKIRSGEKGENEAAYELNFHLESATNWVVIHDLRVEHNGRTAQIDHLVINRLLEMYVCESKRFTEGMGFNEHGEFTAFFGGRPQGIASPIEQNLKHIAVLQDMVDKGKIWIPTRLGFSIKPNFHSLILVSKGARISRPAEGKLNYPEIIKVDQFKTHVEESFDSSAKLADLGRMVSVETLKKFARGLVLKHQPKNFDWYGRYGLNPDADNQSGLEKLDQGQDKVPENEHVENSSTRPEIVAGESADTPSSANAGKADQEKTSKLICHACDAKVAYNVARFCWFNKTKFAGNVYCMACQTKVKNVMENGQAEKG